MFILPPQQVLTFAPFLIPSSDFTIPEYPNPPERRRASLYPARPVEPGTLWVFNWG